MRVLSDIVHEDIPDIQRPALEETRYLVNRVGHTFHARHPRRDIPEYKTEAVHYYLTETKSSLVLFL